MVVALACAGTLLCLAVVGLLNADLHRFFWRQGGQHSAWPVVACTPSTSSTAARFLLWWLRRLRCLASLSAPGRVDERCSLSPSSPTRRDAASTPIGVTGHTNAEGLSVRLSRAGHKPGHPRWRTNYLSSAHSSNPLIRLSAPWGWATATNTERWRAKESKGSMVWCCRTA